MGRNILELAARLNGVSVLLGIFIPWICMTHVIITEYGVRPGGWGAPMGSWQPTDRAAHAPTTHVLSTGLDNLRLFTYDS